MTATLDRPAPHALDPERPAWRDRLLPLVSGSGGWGVTLLVTVIAGLLRFIRLDQPASTLTDKGLVQGPGDIFDEVYYACDAKNLIRYGVEHASVAGKAFCTPQSDGSFVVHPPLGKWLIGVGEWLFGFNTYGWRFSAAVFGTLTVLLVARIGRRMTGSSLLGGLAGLLLALDGLHFVQSRVAMVDVFLCFWIVAAFGALVVDRDQIRERLASLGEPDADARLGRRPWRLVAGLCLGAAVATKWSALFPIVVLLVLALFWEVGARRTTGIAAPWRVTLRRTTLPYLAVLVLLPIAVYVVSWTGWFLSTEGWDRSWAHGRSTDYAFIPDVVRSWWHYHWEMYNFHNHLAAKHPYQSHPLSWPFLGRPVSYYYPPGITAGTYGCKVASCSREVLAIGTWAIWWMMIPTAIGLAARWVSKRDWRAASLLLMMAVSVLAWIPSDLKSRTMFLFYALPSVPFLCLGIALIAGWLLGQSGTVRRSIASAGVGVYTSLVVINFAYLYPILAGVTIPYSSWYARMWFRSWI
ncbi:MAG: phospholipid carrier-dependent glycosyltransferase [Frankiales bacterium]|nr:phospholipid carrier-dependent glycosyltransferase [Frankiales bacterium]